MSWWCRILGECVGQGNFQSSQAMHFLNVEKVKIKPFNKILLLFQG